jgi:hypothetical protein
MKKIPPFMLFLFVLLAACEQSVDTDDWPAHDEKLVVTAFLRLERDSVFAYARVNRTLPLGERFDMQKAMVNDADLRVDNGSRSFPLDRDDGFYPFEFDFNYSFVTSRGSEDTFLLTARHGGRHAAASLVAKSAATRFTDVRIDRSGSGLEDYIATYTIPAPGSDTDVECLVEFWSSDFDTWFELYSFSLPKQANLPGGMLQGSFQIWAYDRQGSKPRLRYRLSVRNRAYRDYINSRWQWNTGDSPFDPPQKNPAFNVTGDGIGFFWYEIVGESVEIAY